MTKISIALAFAFSAGLGAVNSAAAGGNPLSCTISCAQEYNQCIASGIDWSLVSSPSEIGSRTASNMSSAGSCGSDVAACYSGCAG